MAARRVLFRGINAASYIGFLYKCLVIWKGNSWVVGGESFEATGSLGRLKRPGEKFAGMCFVVVEEVAARLSVYHYPCCSWYFLFGEAVVIVVLVLFGAIVVVTIIILMLLFHHCNYH